MFTNSISLESSVCLTRIEEDVREHMSHIKETHEFISDRGAFKKLMKAFETKIIVSEIECTAGIRKTPFFVHKLDDLIVIEICKSYNNDKPLYNGASCSVKEFIITWALSYVIFHFLDGPSRRKSRDELLFERDYGLVFACFFLGVNEIKPAA